MIVSQSSRLILEADKHAGRQGGQMVSCREAAGCICHWATPAFFFVVSSQTRGRAGMVCILQLLLSRYKWVWWKGARGEGGKGGGEIPCLNGRDRCCIEDSAGKQRIFETTGTWKRQEQQGAATGRTHPDAIHTSMPSRKSPYIPDIRIEAQEGRGERLDGDRWTTDMDMDTDAGRDCARHVAS